MTNPFPFSANAVLTAAELNQIGEAVSFTPTWESGVTVGNATQTAHYYELNDMIFLQVDLSLGSTSAITGDVRMALPINSASTFQQAARLQGFCYDVSTANYYSVMGTAYTGSAVRIRYVRQGAGANAALFGFALSSTLPITWASSDRLVFATSYKRA